LPAAGNNSPELALLLCVARVKLPPETQSAVRDLLAEALDWERVLLLAARHGLEPLLYHHLHAWAKERVPAGAMQALREESKIVAGRNLLLGARLKAISAHLGARQIEHIAYRGPLLAEDYYGNSALRVFRDLDILVRPECVEATRDALAEIGFKDKLGLKPSQQAASFRWGFEHPFSAAGGVDLDLHWRLMQRFKARSLDMEGIWKRAVRAPFWGGEVPTLGAEDLAVSLCLHAAHHGWQQISQMCDLAQLFEVRPRLDWEIVESHLGDSNTRRMVYVSLYLLGTHWEAEIPEDLRAKIEGDPQVARLADRIQGEIWPSPSPALTTSSLSWMLDRTSGEDLADRLRLLAGSFFCPAVEDVEAFRLSAALMPLYPGLRVLRLAGKFVAGRLAGRSKKRRAGLRAAVRPL
jgi:hypothetical protein